MITFDKKEHRYFNEITNQEYTSVTKLIKSFTKPFDSNYFSKYKAIERILSPKEFKELKKLAKSTSMISTFNFMYPENIVDEMNRISLDILKEWSDKSIESMEYGTAIHKQKEDSILSGQPFKYNGKEYYYKKDGLSLIESSAVIPELLVSDDFFKVAGQVDLVVRDGANISIFDYKTSKSIDTHNYFQKIEETNLDDCNFNVYQLQLSMYAYMIESLGFKINELYIIHCPKNKEESFIKCQYLRDDVLNLFKEFVFRQKRTIFSGV